MAQNFLIWRFVVIGCTIQMLMVATENESIEYMSKEEREALKEEARDMFYHAYNAYMDNAYPADELMPLSCKGRYRGSEPNRGDIDATLGNFSLTLVDTLDTLVVLGDLEEFENAVKLVIRDVSFDTDVIVSLFETNIRMLGGLLSGHILAEYLQQRADIMPWYRGELLNLAKDLGYRFLPAFNTTTGIPYGRINLKYGMKEVPAEVSRETCTACAGSMILEMAALSRLTGETIFEEKAQKAMDVLWRMRHRGTDLMGSVLNVNSGDWVRRDSGVGAGIDSYYEYCLKAYILLGDEKYLGRFNKHYQAIMKYVSQGPMLLDVHMHRPNTNSKNFMDALLAFWPGLQVLKGDIKPAVETHEMLYQVMQRHNFIPEAFTTDFQVHWGHHPLRPEFLESTYFLYRATGDHYYLGVGRKVLKSLQTYARVPCGYAAVSDVRTNKHDDTMDSFVLSETLKYLFLLFAEPSELVLDLDEFIFTTEGHLLPLTLASIRTNASTDFERDVVQVDEFDRTCPNSLHLFPASVRQPLRNMVEDVCPRRTIKRKLNAGQFQANNLEHLKMLSDMGITILTLADGRVQLLHTFSNAKSPQDSEEGLLFMQELIELNKMQDQLTKTKPQSVTFVKPNTYPSQEVTLLAGPAHFGLQLQGSNKVMGKLVFTNPLVACTDLIDAHKLVGKIAVMHRGSCMFVEKARKIQNAGAIAGIVLDNAVDSSAVTSPMFAMSSDGKEVDDIKIPVVFLFSFEAAQLMNAINEANGDLIVVIGDSPAKDEVQLKAPGDPSIFERLKGSLKSFLTRQTAPQNTENKAFNVNLDFSQNDPEEDQKVVVNFQNLRAEIVKDSLRGEIRITTRSNSVPHIPQKSEEMTPFEEQWRELKEHFVNMLYDSSKEKPGLQIRSFLLQSYFNWVLEGREVDRRLRGLNHLPISHKVSWFLRELSEVAPNPAVKTDLFMFDHLMEANKRRLFRQYLLTKMDAIILNFQNNILKKFKMMALEKSFVKYAKYSLQLCKEGIIETEKYLIVRNLLWETGILTFEEKDEYITQHIAWLDLSHKTYRTLLRKNLETLEESKLLHYDNKLYYDVIIHNLKKEPKYSEQKLLREFKEEDYYMIHNNENKIEEDMKVFKEFQKLEETSEKQFEDLDYLTLKEQRQTYQEGNGIDKTSNADDNTSEKIDDIVNQLKFKNQSKNDKLESIIEALSEESKKGSSTTDQLDVAQSSDTLRTAYKENKSSSRQDPVGEELSNKVFNSLGDLVDEKFKILAEFQKILDHLQVNEKESNKNQNTNVRDSNNNDVAMSVEALEEYKKSLWTMEAENTKTLLESQQKSKILIENFDFVQQDNIVDNRDEHVIERQAENVDTKKQGRQHINDEL